MQKLINIIAECLDIESKCINYFRIQNYREGLRRLDDLTKKLIIFLSTIEEIKEELISVGYQFNQENLITILSGIMNTQNMQDYVLLADLLELQLNPYLQQIQEILLMNECFAVTSADIYESNIRLLEKKHISIANAVKKCIGSEQYILEPTSSGNVTLCVNDNTGSYYFHSNVNPIVESRLFAKQYYTIEHEHYVVFGL